MKKTRLIFTVLAVAFFLGSFQMEAAKSAVRKRFDASLDRFKKCSRGKCTRAEWLKAARDLSIAAVAVVVAGTIAVKSAGMIARYAGYPRLRETSKPVFVEGPVGKDEDLGAAFYSSSDSSSGSTDLDESSRPAQMPYLRRRVPVEGVGEHSDDDPDSSSSFKSISDPDESSRPAPLPYMRRRAPAKGKDEYSSDDDPGSSSSFKSISDPDAESD